MHIYTHVRHLKYLTRSQTNKQKDDYTLTKKSKRKKKSNN